MITIIIVQSLRMPEWIKADVKRFFPGLEDKILYKNNFESTLKMVPKEGEVVIITSNVFHDSENELPSIFEKNANKLGELAKKINPKTSLYVFSTKAPHIDEINVDGFFERRGYSDEGKQIAEIFYHLGFAEKPVLAEEPKKKKISLSFILLIFGIIILLVGYYFTEHPEIPKRVINFFGF